VALSILAIAPGDRRKNFIDVMEAVQHEMDSRP